MKTDYKVKCEMFYKKLIFFWASSDLTRKKIAPKASIER